MRQLSDDDDGYVRKAVARLVVKNPNMTEAALKKLTQDKNFKIRYLANVALLDR